MACFAKFKKLKCVYKSFSAWYSRQAGTQTYGLTNYERELAMQQVSQLKFLSDFRFLHKQSVEIVTYCLLQSHNNKFRSFITFDCSISNFSAVG